MTYAQVKSLIILALSGRPSGQKVLVSAHETAEIAILDYIQDNISTFPTSSTSTAHATSVAKTNCDLTWSTAFPNTDYAFTVNGFDFQGNPVEILLQSKSATKITVQTLLVANLTAIANPY